MLPLPTPSASTSSAGVVAPYPCAQKIFSVRSTAVSRSNRRGRPIPTLSSFWTFRSSTSSRGERVDVIVAGDEHPPVRDDRRVEVAHVRQQTTSPQQGTGLGNV